MLRAVVAKDVIPWRVDAERRRSWPPALPPRHFRLVDRRRSRRAGLGEWKVSWHRLSADPPIVKQLAFCLPNHCRHRLPLSGFDTCRRTIFVGLLSWAADDKYATLPRNVDLRMLAILLRIHPLQPKPHHLKVRWANVEVRDFMTVLLVELAHCNIVNRPKDIIIGHLDRSFAVFVESPHHALPLDVVSIVAGFASLDPILECSAVNTCFASCDGLDGTFSEVFEDNSHELG
jgi:hypothetical protein